mgnify:CR=1 FL=1
MEDDPNVKERKQTSIFDFIKIVIMSLISFDSFSLVGKKGQIGGYEDDEDEGGYGDGGDGDDGGDDEEDSDDKLGLGSLAVKELMGGINSAKNFIMRYVMIIVMFFAYGGIYPSLPIFGVLAVMFSFLKYIMFKFRKF